MPLFASAKLKNKSEKKIVKLLFIAGFIFLGISLILFFLIFYKVLYVEIKYLIVRPKTNKTVLLRSERAPKDQQIIYPVDEEFGIVIPKIGANIKVIPNVNYLNEKEYQYQLTKGVAHARGTAKPGHNGNVFIFAHSAGNWYQANRYNAVFYLLDKLEKNDDIYLFYKETKYRYKVIQKKIVEASDTQYLLTQGNSATVTLMTCWPPGTTLRRLIVIAEISP